MSDFSKKTIKIRLDELLVSRGFARDLAEGRGQIMAGKVLVDETVSDKPGHRFPADAQVRIKRSMPYVSRAGVKLEHALNCFNFSPRGLVCADIGASTGGFTDCLLQHGAAKVFAVDVGYGQLHWKLRTDPRVVTLDRLNAKIINRSHITEPIGLAVFDTSFISLKKVIPPILRFFDQEIRVIALVKPQFELPADRVDEGGIVGSEKNRLLALETVTAFGREYGLECAGKVASPVKGAKGNQEYLVYFTGEKKT